MDKFLFCVPESRCSLKLCVKVFNVCIVKQKFSLAKLIATSRIEELWFPPLGQDQVFPAHMASFWIGFVYLLS